MRRILIVPVFVAWVASPLGAQTPATGSVHGIARDQQGAVVPGVAVGATSPTVPGVYRAVTDGVGAYRLADLPPGEYEIVAELAGFATFRRPAVVVRTGLTLTIDVEMRVGGIGETVEVREETPLLETRSGGQAVNVSGELLRSVPLSERREWFSALAIAPGVVTAEYSSSKLFYVRGADSNATLIQMDGADVTSAAKSGVTYLNLNTDAIDDIQIQTSGIDASAPLGNGGVINIATASGTNQPKGAAGLFYQPRRWNDSNQPGGTSTAIEQTQVDLSFGGPIVKDRVWGFGSYRRTDITTGVSRTPAQLAVMRALVSGYEPIDRTNDANFWMAKGTAQLASGHQLVGFYQRDVNPVFDVQATGQHPFGEAGGGGAAAVRLSSAWSNRLTSRLSASYNDKRRHGKNAGVEGPNVRLFSRTFSSAGRLLGNGLLASLGSPVLSRPSQPNRKLTVSLDTTLYARHRSGSHELQAGVFGQPRVQGHHLSYVNGGFTMEEQVLRTPGVLEGGAIPFHRLIVNGTELTTFEQRGRDFAGYVQDAWRPSPRLTVNAGVRLDHVVFEDKVFDITTQRSLEIGPRFGVNYGMTADGRNVARAHWVRVHDQPGLVTTTGNPSLGQRDLYDLNGDGTFETVFVTPPTAAAIANRAIDPDLHQPFVQEWGAGLSRQFEGSVAVNVDFVNRRFVDRPTLVESNARYDGGVFTGYADERFNDFLLATNNRWNTPVYSSLELSLTKQTARVQALASYVRQWRHIDGTWQPGDPAAIIQPNAFANDKGIGSSIGTATANFDTNSLSGYHMTQVVTASAQWQDHVARAALSLTGPWALLFSTNYTFQSGTWSGPTITRIAAPDPAFGPPTVRLPNGRVVSNPLATTLRFAYPTRGEGQLRTPNLHAWNLRAGRRFAIGTVKVDADLDVFNVTNNGADLGFEFLANQTFNPFFGHTTFRQSPRSAQIVIRASF
ncbi:MAG: TonB-dependent receptor [Acidobacteria bacterium]|nr:TonB-dependent receptor [Acidobacteriota bacterium]